MCFYFLVCLFVSTWQKLELSEKKEPELRRCLQKSGLKASLWSTFLVRGCVRASPLWAVQPLSICSWSVYENRLNKEEAGKQHSWITWASAPASRILFWVHALTFLTDGLQGIKWNDPFPPQVDILPWYFLIAIETLPKSHSILKYCHKFSLFHKAREKIEIISHWILG